MQFRIRIYINGYVDVNPEQIGEDNRLDEALDSLKFSFISNDITNDVPPFTKTVITVNDVQHYYYCSTTCTEIVEMPGYYYHTATLVEAIKITETWVIGSKSFSVIEGKANYNTGYDRLRILNELIYQEYGYSITISNAQSILTDVRAYEFGAGTTYFDMLLAICKNNNCLPYVAYFEISTHIITIAVINFNDIRNGTQNDFTLWSKISKTQSVDNYCSNVVTEMSQVVDRNTLTTCIITPRSNGEMIYKDNSLLRLPTNCESVKYLYGWMPGYKGPTCKLTASLLDFSSTTVYNYDIKSMSVNLASFISTYIPNESHRVLVNQWVSRMEQDNGKESGYYDNAFIYWEKDNYLLMTLWNANSYATQHGWVNLGLLNSDQWNLLTTNQQPCYIYYNSDSNTIDGFNNYKDNESLTKRFLFGQKGPFLKEFYKLGTETDYRRPLIYVDFDEKRNIFSLPSLGSIAYINNYFLLNWDSGTPSYNILDYRWKVVFVAKPHLGATEKKSIQPENETSWKKTTRSYNNGANTVDFNQLIPAMKKSANMLGLEITSVESLEDKEVGTKTQFGYIVSKQSKYNVYNGNKVINNVVYNCCQNYEQIAAAIGIDTQYEATNVPSKGIITRYITVERTISSSIFSSLENTNNIVYIGVSRDNTGTALLKACARLCVDDTLYFVCETEDNYTFDYQKVDSNMPNYYKNNPVAYGDSNQCADKYYVYLMIDTGNYTIEPKNSTYDALPSAMVASDIVLTDNVKVYKDSRERLIFQYKLVRSN